MQQTRLTLSILNPITSSALSLSNWHTSTSHYSTKKQSWDFSRMLSTSQLLHQRQTSPESRLRLMRLRVNRNVQVVSTSKICSELQHTTTSRTWTSFGTISFTSFQPRKETSSNLLLRVLHFKSWLWLGWREKSFASIKSNWRTQTKVSSLLMRETSTITCSMSLKGLNCCLTSSMPSNMWSPILRNWSKIDFWMISRVSRPSHLKSLRETCKYSKQTEKKSRISAMRNRRPSSPLQNILLRRSLVVRLILSLRNLFK